MPIWYYLSRPTHLAFHDFTRYKQPPKNLRSLLGLGLKFIPTPRLTNSWNHLKLTTMAKLKRSIDLRFFHAGTHSSDDTDYDPHMYVKSAWTPPPWTRPEKIIQERLTKFEEAIAPLFKRKRGLPNLLPYQQKALDTLQRDKTFLIAPCDKNLGPAIIETEEYLRMAARDHLSDRRTYKILTPAAQSAVHHRLKQMIERWLQTHKKSTTKMERSFIRHGLKHNKSPFARFYLTLKAHKLKPGQDVRHLKSRPIVSCPGSLLHHLGIWVDRKLQVVAQKQQSYFRNSFALRQQLANTFCPIRSKLFIGDAISMYTKIPTMYGTATVGRHLRRYRDTQDRNFPLDAVKEALSMVMHNNIFTFSDTTFQQIEGTAMGTPPAPPYATLYYGAYEDMFLPAYRHCLVLYKRFIDDVFGIWLSHPDPKEDERQWTVFKTAMNGQRGLEWEFSELSDTVNFMDLTISIVGNRIETTLYEKPLNLHLYIPPHSAHPPGLLPGIVHGTLFRIYTLCTNMEDRKSRTRVFFRPLLVRGYK